MLKPHVEAARTRAGIGRYDVTVQRDIRIPTSDPAVSLSADLFSPVGIALSAALVTVVPYRKDGSAGMGYDAALRWFAARGYSCLLVDFRGTGSSDGSMRAAFDAREADDGVAAVEWAGTQEWCSGQVGMWGHSYGAIMAMRTATRSPAHLKAIAPVMGLLDPERDFVHPHGIRGGTAAIAMWGSHTLLNQVLPPLDQFKSAEEQNRWHARLKETATPWAVELAQRRPGDPLWRDRVVDASAITIPALCVAGWRDLFCEASIRAYEQITGPKQLLVGPWMHTVPEASPFSAIDFRILALQWWDHWLYGINNNVTEESTVTVFLQGAAQRWMHLDSWPPTQQTARLITTSATSGLEFLPQDVGSINGSSRHTHPAHIGDPTLGTLSGLIGMPTSGFGLPVDQHNDDVRTFNVSTHPLQRNVSIVGRPTALVHCVSETSGHILARLTDVDPQGRSTLITSGIGITSPDASCVEIALNPTAYQLPRGNSLRLTLGVADFPRLWPTSQHGELLLSGSEISLPIIDDKQHSLTALPLLDIDEPESPSLITDATPTWIIARDQINDAVSVEIGETVKGRTPQTHHPVELRHTVTAQVSRRHPSDATVRAVCEATVQPSTSTSVYARVEVTLTERATTATAQVTQDGDVVFNRQWHIENDNVRE